MAQSRSSAAGDQGIGTRAADLGAWDKLQLGWLDYEIVVAGQNTTIDLGPHEYNSAKAQGLVVVLPDKNVTTQRRRARGRHQAVVVRRGRRLRGDADPLGRAARRRARAARLPGALEHRGLRRRPVRLRLRRGRRRHRLQGRSRATSPRPPRATASTATRRPTRPRRSTSPPTPARRSSCASTTRPTARRAARTRTCRRACSSTRSRSRHGTTTVFTDGAESGDNGWTAVGFTRRRRVVRPPRTTTSTSRRTGRTRRTTATCRPGRTTSASRTVPNWVEHFPYQNGLLVSYWDTSVRRQQRVRAPGQRPDPADRRQPDADLQPRRPVWRGRDPDLRRAVRAARSRTRSRCTPRPARPATSAARTPSRRSTT